MLALGARPEAALHTYFPSFLSRATPACPPAMKKEVSLAGGTGWVLGLVTGETCAVTRMVMARQGSCCLLPGGRSHQIIEWFGWEGPLKTIQFHPALRAGVLQLSGVPQGWPAVGMGGCAGVQLGTWGVWHAGERVTHNDLLCFSPAPDLHEPVPEPGPTELQCLEAALHQTPCSVQVSAD